MKTMKSIFILLRPHQWLKNLFIFLPLFFNGSLLNAEKFVACLWAFVAYCFAASSIYCFNDIHDITADRMHPKKCKRPIACGAVSVTTAYLISAICVIMSLNIAYFVNSGGLLFVIIACYIVLNILYCIKLKQIALVDVFVIAIGFVLRIVAGGVSADVYLSHWIILMTFLLALFLAFAKRRDDVVMFEETGISARKNVNCYNLSFMNQTISILASITMVCYIMYTVSDKVVTRMNTSYLYLTSVFVLAGIIRYLQITIVDVKSGSPTKVLMKDRFIQCCILGWIFVFFLILYLN